MKPIQLVLIAVALVAALGAGFLMMNLNNKPAPVVVQSNEPIVTIPLVDVLTASKEIPMGTALGEKNIKWEQWPENGVRESFIVKGDRPEALKEYAKTIARTSFFAGEPIREQKIVRSDSGYLSAILPAGKRAIAIRVAAETSAGGFILPNDHVDVVMSYKNPDPSDNAWLTETVLQNVRILAIDQVIEEKDGEKSKVGNTATLELTAQQVEIITAAQKMAGNKLNLALRSVEDAEIESSDSGSHLLSSGPRRKRGSVKIIRYGTTQEVRPRS
ncbi:MAG: Flp pilus assembly protein CpaB [Rhizobiaceae bacterium]|nr:Flp pilus assembly protein CpaB [Rhizobiaceae bacterium]